MNKKNIECRICGSTGEKNVFIAKEKHFGMNDEFVYYECPECNSLMIEHIPDDISKYYPGGYYSKIPGNTNFIVNQIKSL